jgi:hypothetical protein
MWLRYDAPGESGPDESAAFHGKGGLSGICRGRLSGSAISRPIRRAVLDPRSVACAGDGPQASRVMEGEP